MRHRHDWIEGQVRSTSYRACRHCRKVERLVAGQWVGGSRAANPTEQKNIARRLLAQEERW